MALFSPIDWTDHTWNPWQGCYKVSLGCANCYMYRDKKRFGHTPDVVVRSKPATFNSPLKWQGPAKVFVCSWSDFFIKEADPWRDEAWDIIRRTPGLTYQILTKRPQNIMERLPEDWPLSNVWLGISAENDDEFRRRLPSLLMHQATVRFVSVGPMLGPVSFIIGGKNFLHCVDLVVCEGESGPDARIMDPEWALTLKNECKDAGVSFFMKQMARKAPIPDYLQVKQLPDVKGA